MVGILFDDVKKYQKLNKLFRVLPMRTSIALNILLLILIH